MKITYDQEADAMRIQFNDKPLHGDKMINGSLILNLDENGQLIGLELLHVSNFVDEPLTVSLQDITRRALNMVEK